ncbi:MAG: tRNA (adenosine(37)-N6)-threonylcarbamoyltransferase complex ATPase subunit type 1 TsaE [Chlorobi bacterium]|nr:tRNA (adenosine(37)-N6)-threonylcarbamoyltransferase complex ATPase subunit type 1 TsaE [Chlorobiota bacterium]
MLEAPSLSDLPVIAHKIIKFADDHRIIAFNGKMGAGKTTLIKVICEELGVIDEASSPTFSIVNEYITEDDESIYHFDFYRLKKLEEAYDIGIEEYLYSNSYCLMEWPGLITSILPNGYVSVNINEDEKGKRIFKLEII